MDLASFLSVNKNFLVSSLRKPSRKVHQNKSKLRQKTYNEYSQKIKANFNKSLCLSEGRKTKIYQLDQRFIKDKNQTDKIGNVKPNQLAESEQVIFTDQTIKAKSFTFEYYYKNIRQNQQKEKKLEQQNHKIVSFNFANSFTNNLNHQILESMKKYLRKVEKSKSNVFSTSLQKHSHYGLDIKAIQSKRKDYTEQFLKIKELKKQSTSSLLHVKNPRSKTVSSASNVKRGSEILKSQKTPDLQGLFFKNNLNKSQSLKQQFDPKNKPQEKSMSKRLEGMKNNLNLILASFKCVLDKQTVENACENKNFQKFTYYIGYGNNKNLIRSIMKKRWWWTQVQQINSADFVWTQLKVTHLLEAIQKQKKQSENLKQPPQPGIFQQKQTQKIKQQKLMCVQINSLTILDKTQITLRKSPKNTGGSKNTGGLKNLLNKQNQEKFYKIFHRETLLEDNKIFNCKKGQKNQHFFNLKAKNLVHNHYLQNYMFGNKNALFHNLKIYFQFLQDQKKLSTMIPKTYYLQKLNKTGLKQFYSKQFSLSQDQKDLTKKNKNIWIVKPAENSNRGQGISVHTSYQTIRKQICSNRGNGKFIVQKYLRSLFLYQKRKFDIRTYLLMITMGKTTKFFWYSQGYLRTSSEFYNTSDIQNIFIHLTNDAIQCDGQKYGKFEPGNKISYAQFQRYLQTNYPKEKYQMENLNQQMKLIAAQSVRAISPRIKTGKTDYSFQLFGLDFLIDSNFKPWLLQINTNPCLQLGCPVLQRLIPRMLENMFRVCLDPVYQPSQQFSKSSSYFIYKNLMQINRFQLIFDSNYDQNLDWTIFCAKQQEKVYADDNDVFQNEGEQVDINI